MKRIPKIIAAALATVALSASLVLAAGAGSPKTTNDSLPASGADMPMHDGGMIGSMMKGSMMEGSMVHGSKHGAAMMNAAGHDDGYEGGHGGGHNRAATMGQLAALEHI